MKHARAKLSDHRLQRALLGAALGSLAGVIALAVQRLIFFWLKAPDIEAAGVEFTNAISRALRLRKETS